MTDKLFIPAPAGARLDICEWPVDVTEDKAPRTKSHPLLGWAQEPGDGSSGTIPTSAIILAGFLAREYEPDGPQFARAVLPGDNSTDVAAWAEYGHKQLLNTVHAYKPKLMETVTELGKFPAPRNPEKCRGDYLDHQALLLLVDEGLLALDEDAQVYIPAGEPRRTFDQLGWLVNEWQQTSTFDVAAWLYQTASPAAHQKDRARAHLKLLAKRGEIRELRGQPGHPTLWASNDFPGLTVARDGYWAMTRLDGQGVLR